MGYLKVCGIGAGKMVRFYFKVFVAKVLFLGGVPNSICHFSHPAVRPFVRRAPYPRNHTSSIHNFWYMCVKWCISKHSFYLFTISIFLIVSTVKTMKRYKKFHISGIIHRMIIIYDTCVKWRCLQGLFVMAKNDP